MGKCSDLSPRKKGQIRVLIEESGLKQFEIAKKMGISVQSVSAIKKKMDRKQSIETKRNGKCGRRKKTSPRLDRRIKAMALTNRRASCKKISIALANEGICISRKTINNRLLDQGLKAYRPRKKPRLTKKMIESRYKWAKEHKDWSSEDWEKVIKIFY